MHQLTYLLIVLDMWHINSVPNMILFPKIFSKYCSYVCLLVIIYLNAQYFFFILLTSFPLLINLCQNPAVVHVKIEVMKVKAIT